MRLEKVRSGHRLKQKLILRMIRLLSGQEALDVVKTLFYRPELFGGPFSDLCQRVMRGKAAWTVAERELFASFVSKMNACVF